MYIPSLVPLLWWSLPWSNWWQFTTFIRVAWLGLIWLLYSKPNLDLSLMTSSSRSLFCLRSSLRSSLERLNLLGATGSLNSLLKDSWLSDSCTGVTLLFLEVSFTVDSSLCWGDKDYKHYSTITPLSLISIATVWPSLSSSQDLDSTPDPLLGGLSLTFGVLTGRFLLTDLFRSWVLPLLLDFCLLFTA